MGCCQAASTAKPPVSRSSLLVSNSNIVIEIPTIYISMKRESKPKQNRTAADLATQENTPEEDESQRAVYLVNNGEIKCRVPRLLAPDAASTLMRRRKYHKMQALLSGQPTQQ